LQRKLNNLRMQWRNTADRYGFVAQSLHWVIAFGIVAQYFLAEAAEDGKGTAVEPFSAGGVHAALGVTILALASLRLAWRVVELPPERPLTMKSWEITLARVAHVAFYALLFAVPLSGWALATASSQALSFFGWFDLPPFQPVVQAPLPGLEGGVLSKDQLEELHEVLFNVLVGLSLLHIAAALKHQFVDRDSVLRSMLPWRRLRND
jgi:cytochrome b561